MSAALELSGLDLGQIRPVDADGIDIIEALLGMASNAVQQLQATSSGSTAVLGRVRGTGRGVSFGSLVERLEADYPIELVSPFEGSDRVAGAVWAPDEASGAALAKLRWEAGATDLPMHTHEHADRFIIVLEGRGYFHVTGQSLGEFDGSQVRTVPARERDVFLFTRGVVHTFSTAGSAMTLLSCQAPYLAFDDPRQYSLPDVIWRAADHHDERAAIGCDRAWTVLT